MKPRGLLMIEHRLIEKMLLIIQKEVDRIENTSKIDPVFIDVTVDFIRTYADRTHHGKEEDILFRLLSEKELCSYEDKKMMQELTDEHKLARNTVKGLIEAKEKFLNGDSSAIQNIIEKMRWLIDFYPKHIIKEDKIFFPNTEKYFSKQELDKMLDTFYEFDRKMIHEKYNKLVEELRER
jgi:hemerythrin-like domain-containing protein